MARERLGALGVFLARVTDEPRRNTAWRRGAKGETLVGKRLEKHLSGTGVRLLHDRLVPGHGRANIDHIAVGPGGITVIDTKNYRGKVRVKRIGGLFSERRSVLTINGRDQTRLVKKVEDQISYVRKALSGTAYAQIDIAGALCFANVDGLPMFTRLELRGIRLDGARRIAQLANRQGGLNDLSVDRLWRLLGQAFPPS